MFALSDLNSRLVQRPSFSVELSACGLSKQKICIGERGELWFSGIGASCSVGLESSPRNTGAIMVKPRSSSARPSKDAATDKPRIRRIGSLVSQLISRRGYAQVSANETLQQIIVAEVGEQLGTGFQVGNLRHGVLHVYVSDSVTMQELNFRKRGILKRMQRELPDNKIKDLRFRIQS